jgi:sialate O-acetylesterase
MLALAGASWGQAGERAAESEFTRLAGIFGDNMVLQREARVNVWGWDMPETRIQLSASWGQTAVATADETGYWKAVIATAEAGGPHVLTIEGTDTVHLRNILLGEVWLASGQSNMEMPMRGFGNQPITDSQRELLNAHKPMIRIFRVDRNRSEVPVRDVRGTWQVGAPETIKEFSAVAYFFADTLLAQLDVPIGVIGSYWGGTVIEAWMSEPVLAGNFADEELFKPGRQPGRSTLYNGMIHPLIPFTKKGAIWYQGESNRNRPQFYRRLFAAMVESWRAEWQQGDFPFYYVQISPYNYDGGNAVGTALLREAQLQALDDIPNAGMVVSLDHGNCICIHPFDKRPIGERLAYWALKHQYGFDFLQAAGPILGEMKIEGNQAILSFDNAPSGIISRYARLDEFQVAGSNRIFYPATAFVNRDGTLTVMAPEVNEPVAVRYAFRNCPEATLFNTEGLPASSFRTDDW